MQKMNPICLFICFITLSQGVLSQEVSAATTQNLQYYQLYLQCDKKWSDQKIGTSSTTICDSGAQLTCVAMVVAGLPVRWADPGVINQWLKQNNGYQNQNQFVWKSIEKLGFKFGGTSSDLKKLKSYLNVNYSVIANIKNDTHWAMVTTMSDDNTTIIIYDPVRGLTSDKTQKVKSYGWYQKLKAVPAGEHKNLQNRIQMMDQTGQNFEIRPENLKLRKQNLIDTSQYQ